MKRLIVISILFALTAISGSAQNRRLIRVAADTTVETDVVRLGQLAAIEAEPETAARLGALSLGYAPNVGALREIRPDQIRLAVAAAGFADADVALDAPARILVRRAGQTVAPERFRESIESFLAAKFAGERIDARIVRIDAPAAFAVATGEVEIRPNFSVVQNFFQPFSVPVEIRVDGRVFRRVSAVVEIEAFAEVLVAARDLAANQKPAETDVRLEKRRLTKPLTGYLREIKNLRGLLLVKNVAGGTEITHDAFVSGVVVKPGDRVSVEAQSGKLKIAVSGEARAAGRIGDRIAVKNLQSGSILQAVVIDEGLVRILF